MKKQAENILIDNEEGVKNFDAFSITDEIADIKVQNLTLSQYDNPSKLGRIYIRNRAQKFNVSLVRREKMRFYQVLPMQVHVSYTDPTFKNLKTQEINIVKSGNFQRGFKNQEQPAFKSYIMKRDQEKLSIPIDIG